MSPTTHDYEWLVERLQRSETDPRPGWYVCPVHGGGSLHVEQKGGKALVHCHGNDCTYAGIVAALEGTEPTPVAIRRVKRTALGKVVDTYEYTDEDGKRLFRVVRHEPKAFRQQRYEAGAWQDGIGGARLVPFRLPNVRAAAASGATVYVVEGEKDVLSVEATGATATCNPMGAGKWRDEFSSHLKGAQVVIVADNDDPGRSHAEKVRRSLREAGVSPVSIAYPSVGKDVTDHLAAGHGLSELVPRPVLAMALSSVERVAPEPLVDEFAHPSAHTALWGPNGKGKGVFAAWKIAARTRNKENVLILDYEGHVGEWRARIEDFKGDMDRVFIAEPVGLPGGMLKGALWDQTDDIRDTADVFDVDWVYVDSVTAACGVADITTTTAPGPYFAALNAIGRPSVSIGHVTKQEQLAYPFGSMAWRAFIRMGWSFAPGEDNDTRELVNRKTNDYPEQRSVLYDWTWTRDLPPQKVPETLTVTGEPQRDLTYRIDDVLGDEEMTTAAIVAAVSEDGYGPVAKQTVANRLSTSPGFVQSRRGVWRRAVAVSHRVQSDE